MVARNTPAEDPRALLDALDLNELARRYQAAGDELRAALFVVIFAKLSRPIDWLSRRYQNHITGADDLTQEAAVALLDALESWQPVYDANFRAYARARIKWRLILAAVGDQRCRYKRQVLTVSSLDEPTIGMSGSRLGSLLSPSPGPLQIAEARDELRKITESLTHHERAVLKLRGAGHSFAEIAERLSITPVAAKNVGEAIRQKIKYGGVRRCTWLKRQRGAA